MSDRELIKVNFYLSSLWKSAQLNVVSEIKTIGSNDGSKYHPIEPPIAHADPNFYFLI